MKPKTIKFILIFFNIVMFSSMGWSQCTEFYVQLWGNNYYIEETTHLSLSGNDLTGEIPEYIGCLTNLKYLNLSINSLSGNIPSEIGNLVQLETLYLYQNELTGEVPSEIGNLVNLVELNLTENQLTMLPNSLENLDNLINLQVVLNQLTSLPENIGNMTHLEYLNLSRNNINSLPQGMGNMNNLKILDLHSNQLSGEVPSEIGNLTNLTSLNLSFNQFTTITDSICNIYSNLDPFVIHNNNLCPPYPECLTEEDIGEQDTLECTPCQLGEVGYTDVDGICTLVCDEGYTNVDGECTSLNNSEIVYPTTYNLSSPYPNPFNPTTTISFSIPQLGMVSLNVYDITGKLVTTLINEQLNIGYHSIDWDGTNQSGGVYLVRMESGEYVETQKLLLVK